jgi:hypothetical protein
MKRVIFVGAGKSFPESAFTFLNSMQEQGPINVTGLFFSTIDEARMAASYVPIAAPYLRVRDKELQILQANKALFARKCLDSFIKFTVHDNDQEWDGQLFARQTRFADLVVLSGELFYGEMSTIQPNAFLREALHVAECPVMIIPTQYVEPQHVVMAYDGGRDSLFAIKQFCNLFPAFTDLPTEIVHVGEESAKDIPDLDLLKEFARLHFSNLNFSRLQFKAASAFAGWIGAKQNVMLVSGSFGRSPFSYLTRESFSKKTVHDHKMPIFIAHT